MDDTFELLCMKSKALRLNKADEARILGRELRQNICKDRRERIWKVSVHIEECLEDGDIIGAFNVL